MPDTVSTKYGIARVADTDFINSGPATIRSAIDTLDGLIATAITTNPRPAAGKSGRFHRDTTTGVISFDTGAGWVEIAQHAHASKHAAGGSDPLVVSLAMLDADVPIPNIGDLAPTARTTLPANGKWAWADGSLVNKTTYAAFFTAVGHAYNGGVDPGSNMVRLPDLRGRVPVGVDGAAARLDVLDAIGNSGGEQKHTLALGELPDHFHQIQVAASPASHTHVTPASGAAATGSSPSGFQNVAIGGSYGNAAMNNMQPYQVFNYLVRIA